MAPLLKHFDAMRALYDQMQQEALDQQGSKPLRPAQNPFAPATVPEPFQLTQPRPRAVVLPEVLPLDTVPKARPIPRSTYTTPAEARALEQRKQQNRRKAERDLKQATQQSPACAPTIAQTRSKMETLTLVRKGWCWAC